MTEELSKRTLKGTWSFIYSLASSFPCSGDVREVSVLFAFQLSSKYLLLQKTVMMMKMRRRRWRQNITFGRSKALTVQNSPDMFNIQLNICWLIHMTDTHTHTHTHTHHLNTCASAVMNHLIIWKKSHDLHICKFTLTILVLIKSDHFDTSDRTWFCLFTSHNKEQHILQITPVLFLLTSPAWRHFKTVWGQTSSYMLTNNNSKNTETHGNDVSFQIREFLLYGVTINL